MLKIINSLKPFFEDCYTGIGVREYSRLMKITPPTASKLLKDFSSYGLLKEKKDKLYLLFRANRESDDLKDLSRIYWREKFGEFANEIEKEMPSSEVILFGSLSKLETKEESDMDIAIISKYARKTNTEKFEKKYGRKIQIFYFKSVKEISNNLKENILNGFILKGGNYGLD
jgi:predicted nucleotidyltransferase